MPFELGLERCFGFHQEETLTGKDKELLKGNPYSGGWQDNVPRALACGSVT